MNLELDTSFIVMPDMCNYMKIADQPMIFGGAFFAEMDKAAAICVSRLLHDSECDSSVTHKFSGTFHKPAKCGDTIFLAAKVTELRRKGIEITVVAEREERTSPDRDKVAEAKFVFVSRKGNDYGNDRHVHCNSVGTCILRLHA